MDKLNIGICDDEEIMRHKLRKYTLDFFKASGEVCEIYEYSSGEELTAQYDKPLDILFLDIQMKNINGIMAAKEIRKLDDKVCIIFITALSQYAKDGYKVRAYRYLTKPIEFDEYVIELYEAVQEIKKFKNKYITIKNNLGLFSIEYNDIIYVAVDNRKLLIKTIRGDDIITYQALSNFENLLDKVSFFKCHQGFIVNFKYVENVTKNNLIKMRPEFYIPLSKHRKKDFIKRLTTYLGDML